MAKVKIQGHASGTGVFTVTAPNSNTDRTITLPDADVTLGTDATKLPLAGGTMTGNLDLADNVAARFGTSQDFTIKHNGSNTYLQDAGTGDLIVKSNGTDVKIIGDNDEDIAKFTWNDGVDLFFNGSKKFETISGGCRIPSGGLLFGSDTAAANALDDYEEGATAVGSIVVKDGTTTLTCGSGAGIKYTKIGNTVRVQFEFRVTNLNGAGGGSNFKMGLPFQNVAGGYATGSNRIYNGNVAGGEFIAVDSEDTYMKFRRNVNGSATVSQTAATNAYYFGTIVYQTT